METSAPENTGEVRAAAKPLRVRWFTLEALNGLAAAYFFNYLFFYMHDHFGFGNRRNLMLTALHGFMYTFSAWNAGRVAIKLGRIVSLRIGFAGMGLALLIGALVPRFAGYGRGAMFAVFGVLVLWTLSMCLTWPNLQSLLSEEPNARALARTAGIYNVVWAGGAATANFTGGWFLEQFGGESLFWLCVVLHVVQLFLLPRGREATATPKAAPAERTDGAPALNPRPIAKARTFLHLAWLSNPLAYMAIYGVLPVIPKLSEQFSLSHAQAGLVCSVWFWARLGAFVWFWFWQGWHYRLRWLLGAFIAMTLSFVAILECSHLWVLVVAQLVFGLAVGLIYYSSLFYSMDVGASRGKGSGIHEAAIGLGIFAGPAVGVSALFLFPGTAEAGTWAIGGALALGLIPFLMIRARGMRA